MTSYDSSRQVSAEIEVTKHMAAAGVAFLAKRNSCSESLICDMDEFDVAQLVAAVLRHGKFHCKVDDVGSEFVATGGEILQV